MAPDGQRLHDRFGDGNHVVARRDIVLASDNRMQCRRINLDQVAGAGVPHNDTTEQVFFFRDK